MLNPIPKWACSVMGARDNALSRSGSIPAASTMWLWCKKSVGRVRNQSSFGLDTEAESFFVWVRVPSTTLQKGKVMRGSGGTEGGVSLFWIGFGLMALAVYLFFDSVKVSTGMGFLSGWGRHRGGMWETTSMGIIFVPFIISAIILFYDAAKKWAWWLLYIGLGVIAVEILSRVRFLMTVKTTHLLGMFVLFAAGVGLMLKSYRASRRENHGR